MRNVKAFQEFKPNSSPEKPICSPKIFAKVNPLQTDAPVRRWEPGFIFVTKDRGRASHCLLKQKFSNLLSGITALWKGISRYNFGLKLKHYLDKKFVIETDHNPLQDTPK
ncbi:hypothetical protein TNIN_182411 [Trichonephila inaurata madagascariensis]|uniref:Uncharacterized protein n=1 Tax=Trichonephila inaurata madagascariensis TaxID=2747483 RepID=A0A8X7CN70_9ARAC|nr:hypothetical protein TNIN_182411 [Trichonephila inaurata madagascariensis]